MKIKGYINYKYNENYEIHIMSGRCGIIETYDAYLVNYEYSLIMHMFGVSKKDFELYEFIKVVKESNIDSYIKEYEEKYKMEYEKDDI